MILVHEPKTLEVVSDTGVYIQLKTHMCFFAISNKSFFIPGMYMIDTNKIRSTNKNYKKGLSHRFLTLQFED